MDAQSNSILLETEKPETRAAPFPIECCAEGRAFEPGAGLDDRPSPIPHGLPASVLEPWAARHNQEIWHTGPDGMYASGDQSGAMGDPTYATEFPE